MARLFLSLAASLVLLVLVASCGQDVETAPVSSTGLDAALDELTLDLEAPEAETISLESTPVATASTSTKAKDESCSF